jgi:prepilin-type N-terminal cleavage/methylation domain-containing protein
MRVRVEGKKGFTLIEMLLSVAIIAILAGVSTPVYQMFQNRNDLDIATTTIAQSARRAQLLAQAVAGDTSWGIYVQAKSITLFKGAAYLTRDNNFDEVFDLSDSIIPTGMSELVFTKFSGFPQATGSFVLTSKANESRTIAINQKGTLSF